MRGIWLIGICVAVHSAPQMARAENAAEVLLVDTPIELTTAVRTALTAWNVSVARIQAGDPGGTMPDATSRARALAEKHSGAAVVWISESQEGRALWLYDPRSDRAVARPLTAAPPFDEPTAAAVALSIKTLLRHSFVAPVRERFGPLEAAHAAPRIALGANLSAQMKRWQARDVELRLALRGEYYFSRWRRRFGVVAAAQLGPGTRLRLNEFEGRYTTSTGSLGAIAHFAPIDRWHLRPYATASVHFTSIDGTIQQDGAAARANRTNPSFDLGVSIGYALLPWLWIDAGMEASSALRRQRYLVAGQEVLELPRGEFAARLGIVIPVQ